MANLQFKTSLTNPPDGDEVVVSGISGRFPQSENVNEFFEKLMGAKDLLTPVPDEWRALCPNLPPRMGKVNGWHKFDAGYFGMHYHQVNALHPVCRVLLEGAVEAILDAGLDPRDLVGTKTGVFFGVFHYELDLPRHNDLTLGIDGRIRDSVAQVISHYLRLDGPTLSIDSACSSSGLALEHAFRAIREGRCDNAIVCSANLIHSHHITWLTHRLGILDPRAENNVLNDNANGYVRAEACVAMLLQRFRECNRSYAQILHAKTNSDGFKEEGIMHPSGKSQAELIREMYEECSFNPLDVNYVEVHSTGTRAGVPEEAGAIEAVYCAGRRLPLKIGSCKSNMGHSEPVSALCSLVKVLLGIGRDQIPPSINCANPRRDVPAFRCGTIVANAQVLNIDRDRYIGVNNSGFGGTNAHILVKRLDVKPREELKHHFVCVSARTRSGLEQILTSLVQNASNEDYLQLVPHLFRHDADLFLYRGFVHVSNGEVRSQHLGEKLSFTTRLRLALLRLNHTYGVNMNGFEEIGLFDEIKRRHGSEPMAMEDAISQALRILELPVEYEELSECSGRKTDDSMCHSTSQSQQKATNGVLFTMGFNPKVEKLQPVMDSPVNAPPISPLIRWDHQEDWFVASARDNAKSGSDVITINLENGDEDWKFLHGHVIDGRNFLPASALFHFVWATFGKITKTVISETAVLFENCQIHRSIILSKESIIQLSVQIFRLTKRFEVTQSGELVASGTVKVPKFAHEQAVEGLPISGVIGRPLLLNSAYKQLSLWHYQYRGEFCGLEEIDLGATRALVKWNDNWITFIDHMLTTRFFKPSCKSLTVPSAVERLIIDPIGHSQNSEPVWSPNDCSIIKSKCAEVRGLEFKSIPRKATSATPTLESYRFVGYNGKMSAAEALRVVVEIVVQNTPGNYLLVADLTNGLDSLSSPISSLLDEFLVHRTIVSGSIPDDTNLVIGSRTSGDVEVVNAIMSRLKENAFLLLREHPDCVFDREIIASYRTPTETLYLLRKVENLAIPLAVHITDDLSWLSQVQSALGANLKVLLVAQDDKTSGIIGLVNSLKKEYDVLSLSCMFLVDDCPKFDVDHNFYVNQMRKSLFMNVWKEGKWGSYRHFPLEVEELESDSRVVGIIDKGNIASFQWALGPPLQNSTTLTQVYYAGLNVEDLMIANGKADINPWDDRCEANKFCLGFEFSGRNARGGRVMAMVQEAALANMAEPCQYFTFNVPDTWSLEEAATVPKTYCTVLYGLILLGRIRRGQTILLDTGDVGQCGVNVATYFGCQIFTTAHQMGASLQRLIMKATYGKGVDIVLGSLSEDKLAHLRYVAPRGIFLNVVNYDSPNSFDLSHLSNNRTFASINLRAIFEADQKTKKQLNHLVNQGIRIGYVKPIPRRVFEADSVTDALNCIGTTGKVIVKVRDEEPFTVESPRKMALLAKPRFYCDSTKVYILVGGLGGFGLQLAEWLVQRGARNLVLVSRRRDVTDYQSYKLEIWKERGARVIVSRHNPVTLTGCETLIGESRKLGQIDGIFNLAAVLHDGLFESQTKETFTKTFAPKATVTANLDVVSRRLCSNLKHFVVFSSIVSWKGNVAQTNYAMANVVMERICEVRKEEGLPALAIRWGLIGDVGMLEDNENLKQMEVIADTVRQEIESCLQVMDILLMQNTHAVVSSSVLVDPSANNNEKELGLLDGLGKIIGVNLNHVSPNANLTQLGMDSIAVVEIKQFLMDKYKISKSLREMRSMTLNQIREEEMKLKAR
ncbi:hypothetical protein PPYR_03594 [Photinus pyralis]|uniref:Ketosynthase family 3 (KS3) domain-containing protein n=1 Tax=Photinus pyralis TaxID=7054 RepID=A0A5N4A377_PHOPY|nr:hypothetical protein PPYR_03594 [Photinus pyralis]